MNDNRLIGKKEVAELLQASVRTVERMMASGMLEKIKIRGCVRFRYSDVLKLIEKGC